MGFSLQACKQVGCLKAHKTKENNRETSKTKIPAAFQGYRNGTFSLQACKLYASDVPSSVTIKWSDLKTAHHLLVMCFIAK